MNKTLDYGGEQLKKSRKMEDGGTKVNGSNLRRLYVPLGAKKIGEGEQ